MAGNVEWCEAVVLRSTASAADFVREPLNTWSNTVFFVFAAVGLARLVRCGRERDPCMPALPRALFFCEATLLAVGAGSMLFHARATYLAELLDEVPMSVLLAGYLESASGRQHSRGLRLAFHGVVLAGWVLYALTRHYEIFKAIFTVQVAAVVLVSFAAGTEPKLPAVPRRGLWFSIAIFGLAKAVWEYERHLYRSGVCPQRLDDPRYYLHPIWHLGAATAHTAWMSFVLQLQLARCGAEEEGQKRE